MNWTGGHLQRHSTTTVSTKDRQKQHFAKIRQNKCHQVQKKCPIKFSFSCFDAESCRLSPDLSLTNTGTHDGLNSSYPSFDKSLQLSPAKIQAKGRQQICDTEALLGSSIDSENDGISNANLPHRISTINSEIKLSTHKSADKTLSEYQNTLGEPVSKKQKILDIPDWIGIGMSRPSPMNFASSKRNNHDERRFFCDIGQYTPNNHSKAITSKKDFSLIRNENNYSTSSNDGVSTTETVLEKIKYHARPRKASTHPDIVFASSTVCLQHPIPLSSKISCLIKAKSTNDKKSTPSFSNLNQKFYDQQDSLKSINSSMRYFSQNRDFRGCNHKIQLEEFDRELEIRNEGAPSVIQPELNHDNSSSISLPEARLIPISEPEYSYNRMTKKVRLKGLQTYQLSNKFSSFRQEDLKAKRKDPDEVWKNLVFGAYLDGPTNSKIDFR